MIFLRMARFLAILFLYPPALPCFVCSRSALLCLLARRLAVPACALPCFVCLRSALLCVRAICLALSACALPCFACLRSALLCLLALCLALPATRQTLALRARPSHCFAAGPSHFCHGWTRSSRVSSQSIWHRSPALPSSSLPYPLASFSLAIFHLAFFLSAKSRLAIFLSAIFRPCRCQAVGQPLAFLALFATGAVAGFCRTAFHGPPWPSTCA